MANRPSKRKRGSARTTLADPPGFKSLPKRRQVRYLQALWDRISQAPGELPVPAAHIALAKERLAAYRRNPGRARGAREVLDRLSRRDR